MSSSPLSSVPATQPPSDPNELRRLVAQAVEQAGQVLRGHDWEVRVVLAAILGAGHVLLEDVPGVGKTTLARAVARLLGDSFSRIQFTADMLPGDVTGLQVLDPKSGELTFKPGPLFAQVVLADEINRASPKTQSATLEAMGEGAVTIDNRTYDLPAPFVVIATQNPVEHHGAYPLPESQLDRFAVGLSLGYPSQADERALLLAPQAAEERLASLPALLPPPVLLAAQAAAASVTLSDVMADYVLELVRATREHPDVLLGASPRGAVLFSCVARAWAFAAGRDFVTPDDVKELAPVVLAHRIAVGGTGASSRRESLEVVDDILGRVPVPR